MYSCGDGSLIPGAEAARTTGITFRYGVYLNISPDHIGAGNMRILRNIWHVRSCFRQTQCAVVNLEDSHAEEFLALSDNKITFLLTGKATIGQRIFKISGNRDFWECLFSFGRDNGRILLNMPGEFNVENAMAAICIAREEGIDRIRSVPL